jgi:GT2 family glycosyltransferase
MRCLNSLLAQDFPRERFEVIVCDDGSTEQLSGTVEQFQSEAFPIRLIRQDRRGPAAARNLGIRVSASPLVLLIDSDIVADKGLIRNLIAALEKNSNWTGAEACLLPIEGIESPLWEAPEALQGGRFHTAAIAYRRKALWAAGGLDESFPFAACEDVELAARILSQGPIGFVPEAKAYHPRRRVNFRGRWRARRHWKYLAILAKRYGFLAFPERTIGRFPRLRVARSAVFSLPLGRLWSALKYARHRPLDAGIASLHAIFDILCGLWALPRVLFCSIPDRINYLQKGTEPDRRQVDRLPQERHL